MTDDEVFNAVNAHDALTKTIEWLDSEPAQRYTAVEAARAIRKRLDQYGYEIVPKEGPTIPVNLTAEELVLLRQRLVDPETNWAVDGRVDAKLYQGLVELTDLGNAG